MQKAILRTYLGEDLVSTLPILLPDGCDESKDFPYDLDFVVHSNQQVVFVDDFRLWVDDVRPMPNNFNLCAKNYGEAIEYLNTGLIDYVSLDHDLGEEETGYDIACFIESLVQKWTEEPSSPRNMVKWAVHSANPVGRRRIEQAMKSADLYWGIANGQN